jgi:DNA-binding GntR family transcriptional regulator
METMVHAVEQDSEGRPDRVVRDEVHAALTSLILRAEIPPSTRVNIDALATRFRVSTTPVREALARLESDGLVYKVHLRGYRTTGLLTRREVVDLWDFRLRLEPWSAARAAERVDRVAASELRAQLDAAMTAPDDNDFAAIKTFSELDERLHRSILAIAGNEVVERAFDRMHCHLHAFRLTYDLGAGSDTIVEHRAVVEAIARADPLDAAHRMAAHLEASRDRILPFARDEEPGEGAALR